MLLSLPGYRLKPVFLAPHCQGPMPFRTLPFGTVQTNGMCAFMRQLSCWREEGKDGNQRRQRWKEASSAHHRRCAAGDRKEPRRSPAVRAAACWMRGLTARCAKQGGLRAHSLTFILREINVNRLYGPKVGPRSCIVIRIAHPGRTGSVAPARHPARYGGRRAPPLASCEATAVTAVTVVMQPS